MRIQALGREHDGFLDTVEIHYLDVGMGRLLRHLGRIPGLVITSRRSWRMTDDYWIEFTWRDQEFSIDSPFVHYWLHRTRECPDDVFQELLEHMVRIRVPLLRRWYFRLRGIRYDEGAPAAASPNTPMHLTAVSGRR